MSERRVQKYNSLIAHKLGKILFDVLDSESGVLVTLTRVQTTEDLLEATAWVSVYPSSKAKTVMEKITKLARAMQGLLIRALRMKPIPKIRWALDKSPEQAGRVEELLEKTKNE